MQKRNENTSRSEQGRHGHPLPNEISKQDKDRSMQAHDEAEKDIEEDAELSAHSPNDDLDEGEAARLGEDTGDII